MWKSSYVTYRCIHFGSRLLDSQVARLDRTPAFNHLLCPPFSSEISSDQLHWAPIAGPHYPMISGSPNCMNTLKIWLGTWCSLHIHARGSILTDALAMTHIHFLLRPPDVFLLPFAGVDARMQLNISVTCLEDLMIDYLWRNFHVIVIARCHIQHVYWTTSSDLPDKPIIAPRSLLCETSLQTLASSWLKPAKLSKVPMHLWPPLQSSILSKVASPPGRVQVYKTENFILVKLPVLSTFGEPFERTVLWRFPPAEARIFCWAFDRTHSAVLWGLAVGREGHHSSWKTSQVHELWRNNELRSKPDSSTDHMASGNGWRGHCHRRHSRVQAKHRKELQRPPSSTQPRWDSFHSLGNGSTSARSMRRSRGNKWVDHPKLRFLLIDPCSRVRWTCAVHGGIRTRGPDPCQSCASLRLKW